MRHPYVPEAESTFIWSFDMRFGFPSFYGVNQCRVILLCLISITLTPLRESLIQNRGIAAIAGDTRRVSYACMCARQQCSACPGIEIKGGAGEPFDRYLSLQILHLPHVVMSSVHVRIAQHGIVRGLVIFTVMSHLRSIAFLISSTRFHPCAKVMSKYGSSGP